jgi:hypothetical protein
MLRNRKVIPKHTSIRLRNQLLYSTYSTPSNTAPEGLGTHSYTSVLQPQYKVPKGTCLAYPSTLPPLHSTRRVHL